MKKLLFLVMLVCSLISCHSGDEMTQVTTNENGKTVSNSLIKRDGDMLVSDEEQAIVIIQIERKLAKEGKEEITDDTSRRAVTCHTDYLNDHFGQACVTINGQTFNVTWSDLVVMGHFTEILDEPKYTATPVKSCHC